MKTITIYFSLLGHNSEIAKEIADKENTDLREFAPGGLFRVFQFFFGKKRLMKKVKELNNEIYVYNEITICGPIWAGKPAPAVNALLNHLDFNGKKIRCHFTYTQDYGTTEDYVKDLIESNLGKIVEIKFKNISKKKS